jgi:hypothetical protein
LLDILIPTPAANQALVPDAVEQLVRCTDVPFRLIVIVDGGVRPDLQQLEDFLAAYDKPWKLLHNPTAVYLNQTLREGIDECVAKQTVVMGPQVRLDDVKWFGKVQQIFHRDPTCCVVDLWPNTKSTTLYPLKRAHNNPAAEGCRFIVVSTQFAKSKPPYGRVDPVTHWSRAAIASGGSSWAAPGVRYMVVDHKDHETWREPLASQNPSA